MLRRVEGPLNRGTMASWGRGLLTATVGEYFDSLKSLVTV